jgi:sulfur-oxidizing protein SoxY
MIGYYRRARSQDSSLTEEHETVKPQQQRRLFIKGTLAGGAVVAAAGLGLIQPRLVLAAWPTDAFHSNSLEEALNKVFGSSTLEASDKVVLKAPGIAENGAVVPISINAEQLENVESISIFSEKNPTPLVARFKLKPGCVPEVSTRIKMGESGDVIAVVQAGGKLYSATTNVKVTVGGCGG